jgi:hypothetical protein
MRGPKPHNVELYFTTLHLRFGLTVGNRHAPSCGVRRSSAHHRNNFKPAVCNRARTLSVCVQRQARTLLSHEVPAMIFRVAIPLLLLPVLAVTLPLMFALAWLHEALGDMAPARQAPDESWKPGESWKTAGIISLKKQ